MVKIKQKKTMNLPHLIEHIWANNLRHKWKDSDNTSAYVQVYDDGQLVVDKCTKDSVFTVEVEEEVNGETILGRLYEVYFDGLKHDTNMFTNTTTNSLITSKTALIYTVIDNQVIVLWEKYTGGFR